MVLPTHYLQDLSQTKYASLENSLVEWNDENGRENKRRRIKTKVLNDKKTSHDFLLFCGMREYPFLPSW